MACFNVTHLVRRGGMHCFRMAVPQTLVKQFGRREIKGSLKTSNPITAKMRCRKLSNAFERLIESARTMPDLTPETITGLIQSYFQRCLNTSEEIALQAPTDSDIDLDAEVEGLRSQQEALRQALGRRTYDQITRREASEVLEGVRRFRDTLLKLPSNYMKSKEMQGKPLTDVLAAEKGGPALANKTGQKYFQNLKAFLKWAVNEGYLSTVPGAGLKMPGVSKADAQEARYPFSPEQLQTLFALTSSPQMYPV